MGLVGSFSLCTASDLLASLLTVTLRRTSFMERPVEQVAQLLEKKATFLRGVKSLAHSLNTAESAASLQATKAEVFNLVRRESSA
jgi:hypothetical protein